MTRRFFGRIVLSDPCFGDYLWRGPTRICCGDDAGVVQALLRAEADDEPWDVVGLGR